MKRPIKFRAYIPDLQITVYEIAVYNDGAILAGGKEFNDRLKENPDGYIIDPDVVWDGGNYEGYAVVLRYNKEKNDYDEFFSFIPIDGSLLIDADQCVISQYTGLNDSNRREIYENDILELEGTIPKVQTNLLTVHFRDHKFIYNMYYPNGCIGARGVPLQTLLSLPGVSTYTVVGSLPQDRNLIYNQKQNNHVCRSVNKISTEKNI